MPVPDTINSVELRRVLESSFNEEELKTLCFDLSIDYEALAASGKAAKCREIVLHAERIECLNELWDLVVELRPHLINLYSEGDFPTEELFEDRDLTLLKRLTLKSERYSKIQRQLIISNEDFRNEYLKGIKLPGEIRLPELPGGKKLAGELEQVKRTIIYGTDLGRANLSDAFIQSVDLQRVVLDEAILEKADFRNARFFESSLKSANLSEADLSSIELLGGDLSNAVLLGSQLISSVLENVSLKNSRMESANFTNATLTDVDLSGANLTDAIFDQAVLHNVNLTNTNLDEASFLEADLRDVNFYGSNITDIQLSVADSTEGVILPDGSKLEKLRNIIVNFASHWTQFDFENLATYMHDPLIIHIPLQADGAKYETEAQIVTLLNEINFRSPTTKDDKDVTKENHNATGDNVTDTEEDDDTENVEWRKGLFFIALPDENDKIPPSTIAILLAELYGRIGYFPTILKRPRAKVTKTTDKQIPKLIPLQILFESTKREFDNTLVGE